MRLVETLSAPKDIDPLLRRAGRLTHKIASCVHWEHPQRRMGTALLAVEPGLGPSVATAPRRSLASA